ncbi:F0F1 ATP synthase subunit delta [Nakamurella lactea]|uniref:F0F1 ATP synthase subunit delta n=1 Tax=Nakamurella lactea TaxID=459515 RepID=UPI00042641D6|nr:F0F1 ATP synthase subunit delta [Nakamurella lactea]
MQHISSRQALDDVTATLVGGAATLSDADLQKVGTDLLHVSGVLRAEPVLRRTLSESTTSAEARTGVVNSLFSGKIHPTALSLVTDAVAGSWATGADLRDGIERLGRSGLFLGAERSGQLDQIENELFRFGRVVDANPALSVLLDDPAADPQGRKELIIRLLDGRANPLTVELLADLATDTRTRTFSSGVAELVEQAAERRNKVTAIAQTSIELDNDQRARLAAALERIYGRPVALHLEVDPALAGGMRVTVGDEVIDGSVAGQLANLRRRLAG